MKLLFTFLKGMFMGICDVIPGISGGTIAFITGIYERLINAVKAFSPKLLKDLVVYLTTRKNLPEVKEGIKKLDLVFLITLFAGIGTAILLGSRAVTFLLDNYFVLTLSFFVGLIVASSKVIFDHIEDHSGKNIAFGIVGLIIGILLAIVIPSTITPTLPYIFLSGFLAISAMFLPGISGSFILLIMGSYEFMLGVLHNVFENIPFFLAFGVGAVLGALGISRGISFLFRVDKPKTLYALLGLVIGCLSIPIKDMIAVWGDTSLALSLVVFFVGALIVFGVNRFQK